MTRMDPDPSGNVPTRGVLHTGPKEYGAAIPRGIVIDDPAGARITLQIRGIESAREAINGTCDVTKVTNGG